VKADNEAELAGVMGRRRQQQSLATDGHGCTRIEPKKAYLCASALHASDVFHSPFARRDSPAALRLQDPNQAG